MSTPSEDAAAVAVPGAEAVPSPATPDDVTRIGRYEVRGVLGRGGMGCVHRAFDPVLEREVALKVMRAEIVGDPEQKQRFEREARAVARLSHPGVVTVFDLGYHTDGSPYIVMELLRGQDLLARMRAEPPLSLEEKVAIVGQILDGLAHAHRSGIVHRDIKPANVFLTEEGSARIMDFGLAFFTSSAAASQSIMGTVSYMSTEQVRGERLDGRSDLFSVGTLLCEMLTGRRPFDGETPPATLYRIVHDEPRIELPSGREQPFLPVLKRALARKADERYQTGAEFAAELRACLEHARAAGVARGAPPPLPAAAPPAVPAPASPAGHRKADPSGLFRVLREIYVGGRTGQLHLTMGGRRKCLRILKGRILHGTSDLDGEHLGDVLVRFGLLGQADLERAVAVVLRERKRLGTVLSETGLLELDALQEAVGIHVREIVFSALDGADVSVSFEDLAESSLDTDLVCPQSMGQVILEATRRVFDPALVRRLLGDTKRVLVLSPDPLLRSQKITLTPADGFVLSRVDGTLSAREVMDLSPLSEEDTERSLFSLLCTGIIGYREEVTGRPAPSGQTTVPPARRVPPPSPASPPAAAPRSEPTPPAAVPPPALAAPPASKPAAAPTAAAVPAVAKPTPTPPPPAVFGTAEIRVILEASAQARRDPFAVLGLEPTADEAEVRAAYARLARILHPDVVLDPSLDDLRPLREAAFVQLGQAVETLRSPGFRQYAAEKAARARARSSTPAPDAPPVAPPTAPPAAPPTVSATVASAAAPPVDAEELVRVARGHFDADRFWDAIQVLEPLVPQAQGATRDRARLLLAQTYLKNPKWTKRAEQLVLDLVRESPQLVAAHLLLAEIYRSSGLAARARAAYQKVLALQPENETAAERLAELEPPPPAAAPPGRLRGIFAKR